MKIRYHISYKKREFQKRGCVSKYVCFVVVNKYMQIEMPLRFGNEESLRPCSAVLLVGSE